MTTITATEMRKLTNAYIAEQEAKVMANHKRYLNEYVEPTIRNNAKDGASCAIFNYAGMHIDFERIAKALRDNGFEVKVEIHPIRMIVKW